MRFEFVVCNGLKWHFCIGNLDMYLHHSQRQDLKPCIIGSMRLWKLNSAPRSAVHATGNPPTRVGVPTILIFCKVQNASQNPKSAPKELLHDTPGSKIQNSKILKPKTQNPAPGPSQEELPTFSDIYQTVKPLSKHDVQSFLTSIAPVCSAQFNSEVASNMFYRKCRFLLLQEYFSGVVAL